MKIPPLLARALTIGAVAVLLLAAIEMISGKVSERRARAEVVAGEVAAETVSPQVVAGPILALACQETTDDGKTRPCPDGYFMPLKLSVNGSVPVETRRRGIYPVRFFHASLDFQGEVRWPDPPLPNGTVRRAWSHAYLAVQVSDTRGIKGVQSSPSASTSSSGPSLERAFAIQQPIPSFGARKAGDVVPFTMQLRIDGTSRLQIVPIADETVIQLKSDWRHPSFLGLSPDERRVGPGGFEAKWNASSLATGGFPSWEVLARSGNPKTPILSAGVSLIEPVNVYSLSYRATEYAFLFILFTFTALALVETLANVRLHAIQYGLVGSAIAVFFLLLLAISEHSSFTFAYASAAIACTTLMTIYLRHPLGSRSRTAWFGALFAGVYAMLYVLLLREEDALLVGSLMVFAMLAATMLMTRKVDWGKIGFRPAPE